MNPAETKRQGAFWAGSSADGDDHRTALVFRGFISLGNRFDVPVWLSGNLPLPGASWKAVAVYWGLDLLAGGCHSCFSDDICPESWYHPQFFCSFLYRRHGSVPGAGEETIYMRRAGCYFICMQALCVAAEEIQEKR